MDKNCIQHSPAQLTSMRRRELLQVGFSTAMGLGLSGILSSKRAAANEQPNRRFGAAKNVIIIYQTGGASQIDTFDPKPDAPAEIRGDFHPISTRIAGVQIAEHLAAIRIAGRSLGHHPLDVAQKCGAFDGHASGAHRHGGSRTARRPAGRQGRLATGLALLRLGFELPASAQRRRSNRHQSADLSRGRPADLARATRGPLGRAARSLANPSRSERGRLSRRDAAFDGRPLARPPATAAIVAGRSRPTTADYQRCGRTADFRTISDRVQSAHLGPLEQGIRFESRAR